jgi:hypothetical protein
MAFLRAPICVLVHVANVTCAIEVPKIKIKFDAHFFWFMLSRKILRVLLGNYFFLLYNISDNMSPFDKCPSQSLPLDICHLFYFTIQQ